MERDNKKNEFRACVMAWLLRSLKRSVFGMYGKQKYIWIWGGQIKISYRTLKVKGHHEWYLTHCLKRCCKYLLNIEILCHRPSRYVLDTKMSQWVNYFYHEVKGQGCINVIRCMTHCCLVKHLQAKYQVNVKR